jgi:hypothetical protein
MAYPRSDSYERAFSDGAELVSFVELLNADGIKIADSQQEDTFLLVDGGSITADASGSARWTLSNLVLLDPIGTLLPASGRSLLSPLSGNELRVWCGLAHHGIADMFPQGTYGISRAAFSDGPQGATLTVNGTDRSRRVARAKSTKTYVVDKGPAWAAIVALYVNRVPEAASGSNPNWLMNISTSEGGTTDRQVLEPGTDPWGVIQAIAESAGLEAYFDALGIFTVRPIPNPRDPNVPITWSYDEGTDATVMHYTRAQESDSSPNGIIVTGEHTSNVSPPRGEAWDDDPTSPTYRFGPYKEVPEFVTDPRARLQADAEASARGRLYRKLGVAETVEFAVMPNPVHEPSDVLRVYRGRSGLDTSVFLDRYTLPLRPEGSPEMVLTARERRIR